MLLFEKLVPLEPHMGPTQGASSPPSVEVTPFVIQLKYTHLALRVSTAA